MHVRLNKYANAAADALISGIGGYYASKSDFVKKHPELFLTGGAAVLGVGALGRAAGNAMWDHTFMSDRLSRADRYKIRRRAKLIHALGSLGVDVGGSGLVAGGLAKHRGVFDRVRRNVDSVQRGIDSLAKHQNAIDNTLRNLSAHQGTIDSTLRNLDSINSKMDSIRSAKNKVRNGIGWVGALFGRKNKED